MRFSKRILFFAAGISIIGLVSCATTNVETKKKAEAHFKLGISHLNVDNLQRAFVEFQTALNLDPENKEVHNALGTVYLELQDLKAAEEHYREASRLDPKYSEAHNNLCYVYYRLKQYRKSIASCAKALENPLYLTPEKSFYNMGRSYYRLSDYDKAIDAYENSLRRYPGLYLSYYGIALALNAKHDYGKAASVMNKALEMDPQFKGDIRKAEETFSRSAEDPEELRDFRDFLDILKY